MRERFFYFFDEAEGRHRLWFTGWGQPQARMKLATIADTHPKDGDVKQAPLVSGGGSEGNRT